MLKAILKHKETGLLIRFISVGLLCSFIFYFIYIILLHASVQYQLASTVGYLSGTVSSYFLNKLWTFKSTEAHTITGILLFALVYILALSVNLGILTLLVHKWHMNKYFAQIFAIGFSAVFSYSGNRFIVFKPIAKKL